jgi:hypothetical protein
MVAAKLFALLVRTSSRVDPTFIAIDMLKITVLAKRIRDMSLRNL